MTISTRLPKPLRENALAQHAMYQEFAYRRLEFVSQLMRLNGKFIKWTKRGEDLTVDPGPGFVHNDLKQLAQVKKDIRCHLMELKYAESRRRFDAYLQSQALKKNQRDAKDAIAAGDSRSSDTVKRAGLVRDRSFAQRGAEQLLQLLEVQRKG